MPLHGPMNTLAAFQSWAVAQSPYLQKKKKKKRGFKQGV